MHIPVNTNEHIYISIDRDDFFMKSNFIKCGATGLCLEVIWTGILNLIHHDYRLMGNTSILMFPIYGMAALIKPFNRFCGSWNVIIRGIIYTICIFTTEYLTGSFLKKHHMCPWDYSKCKYNVNGLIRMDFAPAWFLVGLLFEKLLKK